MKRKTKERIGYIALNIAFILLCLVTLIPIYYAVNVSFSGPGSSLSGDFSFLPRTPRWKITAPSFLTSHFCYGSKIRCCLAWVQSP